MNAMNRTNAVNRTLIAALGAGAGLAAWAGLRRLREADLRGQVALVTGGSRGLGLLIARELAREGCRLVVCARDLPELRRAEDDLRGRGADVLVLPCDVADRAQVDDLIAAAARRFGGVDVLVNNAGIIQVGPVERMELPDYEAAMAVMFWGVVYPTLAVLPQMRARRRGRIVNVTSIGGKVSVPHLLPYCAAKFAATGFSQGLRAELAGTGVAVTTIAPGLMRTGSGFNTYVKGHKEAEFTLFALLASLPPFSMDAERAARQIVRAAKRGDAERTLSVPATLLARFHGIFPGLTADLMGLADRALLPPAEGGSAQLERAMEIDRRLHSRLFDAVTAWSRSAAQRFNEYPGPVHVPAPAGTTEPLPRAA